jgi:hypothetical protein
LTFVSCTFPVFVTSNEYVTLLPAVATLVGFAVFTTAIEGVGATGFVVHRFGVDGTQDVGTVPPVTKR